MPDFTESVIEESALDWLEGLGYALLNGFEIAPIEQRVKQMEKYLEAAQ